MRTSHNLTEAIVTSLLAALAVGFIAGIVLFHLLQPPIEYGHLNEACIGCVVVGVCVGVLLFLAVFFFLFKALYKLKPKAKRIFSIVMITLIVVWGGLFISIFFE